MSLFEQSVSDAIVEARAALDSKVGLGTIRQVERDVLAMLLEAVASPGVEPRTKATVAATRASEAVHELLMFAREGNQMASTAYSISVAENLADAIRLAIDAQGGPEDDDEAQFYAAVARYLDGPKPAWALAATAPDDVDVLVWRQDHHRTDTLYGWREVASYDRAEDAWSDCNGNMIEAPRFWRSIGDKPTPEEIAMIAGEGQP